MLRNLPNSLQKRYPFPPRIVQFSRLPASAPEGGIFKGEVVRCLETCPIHYRNGTRFLRESFNFHACQHQSQRGKSSKVRLCDA